jgi:hypothetical protein
MKVAQTGPYRMLDGLVEAVRAGESPFPLREGCRARSSFESVSEHLEWRPVPGWRERCVEDDEVGRREL